MKLLYKVVPWAFFEPPRIGIEFNFLKLFFVSYEFAYFFYSEDECKCQKTKFVVMGAPQQLKVLGWRTPTAGLCCGLAPVSQVWWEPWIMREVDECRIVWHFFFHNSTAVLKIYKCILNVWLRLSDLLFFKVITDGKIFFFILLFNVLYLCL